MRESSPDPLRRAVYRSTRDMPPRAIDVRAGGSAGRAGVDGIVGVDWGEAAPLPSTFPPEPLVVDAEGCGWLADPAERYKGASHSVRAIV
jgi:hypothetical protein